MFFLFIVILLQHIITYNLFQPVLLDHCHWQKQPTYTRSKLPSQRNLVKTFFVLHSEVLTDLKHEFKKQLPKVFYRKGCFQTFCSIHRKTPVFESLFSKFVGLKADDFITKRLQHTFFPLNFAEFFKNLKAMCKRLLLNFIDSNLK